MRPYDDERYLQWYHEFSQLVYEFLDTEGNTLGALQEEFENAVEENAQENVE